MLQKRKYLCSLTYSGTCGFMPTNKQDAFDRLLFSEHRLQRHDFGQLENHKFHTAAGGNHCRKNSNYNSTTLIASLYKHLHTHKLHSKIN